MIQLAIYAVVALVIMGGVGYGVGKIKDAGRAEVRAELQPKLDTCRETVKRQDEAVKALKTAADAKAAEGAKALREAGKRAKVWEDNAVRLQRALAGRKPTDPQDCKSAWEAIRKP